MSWRNLLGRVAWFAIALGAASCSSGSSTTPTSAGVTETTEETVEIYSNLNGSGDTEGLHALFDVHRARHPAAHIINTTVDSADWSKEYIRRREAGNPPDVITWVAEGLAGVTPLYSLDEFLTSDSQARVLEGMYPQLLADVTIDGKIYGLPWSVSRTNTLIYNKQVLADHNLNPPTTIADLLAACKQLKAAGVATPLRTGASHILLGDVLAGAMGIDAYHSFVKGEAVDESALRDAINVFGEVVDNCVDRQTLVQPEPTTDPAVNALMSGTTPLFLHYDQIAGALEQLGWTAGIDYGMTVAPGSAGLFTYLLWVLAIPANAPHLQGALNLLDTAASVEGQTAVSKFRNVTAARSDVDLNAFDSERRAITQEMIQAKYRTAPDKRSAFGWTKPINAFVQSTPHDTEALLQALVQAPSSDEGPSTSLPNGEGLVACATTDDCLGTDFCDKKASPPVCRPTPTGQGNACQSDADCAGFGATYCEAFVSHTCVVRDCSPELNDCSDDYICCGFASYGLPSLCVSRALNGDTCR